MDLIHALREKFAGKEYTRVLTAMALREKFAGEEYTRVLTAMWNEIPPYTQLKVMWGEFVTVLVLLVAVAIVVAIVTRRSLLLLLEPFL